MREVAHKGTEERRGGSKKEGRVRGKVRKLSVKDGYESKQHRQDSVKKTERRSERYSAGLQYTALCCAPVEQVRTHTKYIHFLSQLLPLFFFLTITCSNM